MKWPTSKPSGSQTTASGAARVCFDDPGKGILGKPAFIDQNRALQSVDYSSPNGGLAGNSFARITLPDCTLDLGAIAPGDPMKFRMDPLTVSPDRHAFAYTLPPTPGGVEVRDTTALKVMNEIQIPPGMYFELPIYTPDGRRLIVLASNTLVPQPETKRHLFFYGSLGHYLEARFLSDPYRIAFLNCPVPGAMPPSIKLVPFKDLRLLPQAVLTGATQAVLTAGYTKLVFSVDACFEGLPVRYPKAALLLPKVERGIKPSGSITSHLLSPKGEGIKALGFDYFTPSFPQGRGDKNVGF